MRLRFFACNLFGGCGFFSLFAFFGGCGLRLGGKSGFGELFNLFLRAAAKIRVFQKIISVFVARSRDADLQTALGTAVLGAAVLGSIGLGVIVLGGTVFGGVKKGFCKSASTASGEKPVRTVSKQASRNADRG